MPSSPCNLNGQQFASFIVNQLPVYSDEILRDIRPTDALSVHIDKGQWDSFAGVQQTQDRFRNVKANTAKAWVPIIDESCNGTPCDTEANEICWGNDRLVYGQETQSWRSQLQCFDQLISKTKAVEHFMQIISSVLMPATVEISSSWVRRKSLELAGRKLLADGNMSSFTGSWTTTGNEQIYYTPSAFPTSKLTPQMIKRQIPYLRDVGYFGMWSNEPFWGGYDNFAELITDDDTCWELDKISADTRISDAWRFQMWQAAHEYYAFGMGGQIGNYMTHIDPNQLRFNKVGSRLQYVPRYRNVPAANGIGSEPNPDYYNAQYAISFIWHRYAWQMLVQQMQSINSKMPFLVRGLNGEWYFAIHDLGADCVTGAPIQNYKQNKGIFWADFRYGARPRHTEFLTAILHKREPTVIYTVDTCAADPGYPTQNYNSECDSCDTTFSFIPEPTTNQAISGTLVSGSPNVLMASTATLTAGLHVTGAGIPAGATILTVTDSTHIALSANATLSGVKTLGFTGNYQLAASTVTCDSNPIDNGAINASTLAALVTALNGDAALGALGTWSLSGTTLVLTDAICSVSLPWVTT